MNKTYYFTYGTNGYPYVGGWTEIEAPNAHIACEIFRTYHPDRTEGLINCSSIYSENEFYKTEMQKEGNYGARCQERITLKRIIN